MFIKLDGSGTLAQQIYHALRRAILAGQLAPGARLPATRTLGHELGVSRNTVLLAYDQLLAEGYTVGQTGSGTYVASALPDVTLAGATVSAQGGALGATVSAQGGALPPDVDAYAVRAREGTTLRLSA